MCDLSQVTRKRARAAEVSLGMGRHDVISQDLWKSLEDCGIGSWKEDGLEGLSQMA